jgi:hypothetical protein
MNTKYKIKVNWNRGYVTDWKPSRINGKFQESGTARYVALDKQNQIVSAERKSMHIETARKMGLV